MILSDHQGQVVRDAIIPPYLQDVFHKLWFGIQILPSDCARLKWVVLERDECQVREPIMGFQISHEAPHPGGLSLCVGPNPNVVIDALENRASEFELRVHLVNCRRPLQVQRAVVFWHGVLAVGLFTHLDIADSVAPLLEVSDLRSCIVGRAVQHSHRDHRWKIVSDSAGKERVKSCVLVKSIVSHVLS